MVGIDVGAGIQVLKKSVKHPRSLPHTCARAGRTSERSQGPTLRTSKISSRVNEDRFLCVIIYTVTRGDFDENGQDSLDGNPVDCGTVCLYTVVVKQFFANVLLIMVLFGYAPKRQIGRASLPKSEERAGLSAFISC